MKYIFFLLLIISMNAIAQKGLKFTVHTKDIKTDHSFVFVRLDNYPWVNQEDFKLIDVEAQKNIPFQIDEGAQRILSWEIKNKASIKKDALTYKIVKTKKESNAAPVVSIDKNERRLQFKSGKKTLIQYNHAVVYPPKGIDSLYKRSGFLHPVYAPNGAVLTRIQPKDHYHHYGIWNPWTKTTYNGEEIDFWNLKKGKGTVRFNGFLSVYEGNLYSYFKAYHQHIIHPQTKEEKNVLNETWTVKIYHPQQELYVCDFISELSCATELPLLLNEYRYGGFGFRARKEWTNKNTQVLTSQGNTRKNADGSTAKWCAVWGETEKGTAGILFLSHPANYNHPEPLRVWPVNANNDRGDVFVNFCPTKNKDWKLLPKKHYVLRYRMVIFDGEITAQKADALWESFANPVKARIEIIN